MGKGGHWDQMERHILDPLDQVLESRHAVQKLVLASLASGFPYFCSCGFRGYTSQRFTWTSAPSSFLYPSASACAASSHGSEVSKKMALRPRAQNSFLILLS